MGVMFGTYKTWKVVYTPKSGLGMSVAFVEAVDRPNAMFTFYEQYAGQYHTVDSCILLG